MSNGTYPNPQLVPYSNRPAKPRGLGVRMGTRWRRARLDDELAGGASPAASAELTLRATQLSSPVVRSQLVGALPEGCTTPASWSQTRSKAVGASARIRDCADDLLTLAGRLGDKQPVDVRGAAMTARLLSDNSRPPQPNTVAATYGTRCVPPGSR
jgi:hypothetical protein